MKSKFITILTLSTLAFFATASAKSDASESANVKSEIATEVSAEISDEVSKTEVNEFKKMRNERKEARKSILEKFKADLKETKNIEKKHLLEKPEVATSEEATTDTEKETVVKGPKKPEIAEKFEEKKAEIEAKKAEIEAKRAEIEAQRAEREEALKAEREARKAEIEAKKAEIEAKKAEKESLKEEKTVAKASAE